MRPACHCSLTFPHKANKELFLPAQHLSEQPTVAISSFKISPSPGQCVVPRGRTALSSVSSVWPAGRFRHRFIYYNSLFTGCFLCGRHNNEATEPSSGQAQHRPLARSLRASPAAIDATGQGRETGTAQKRKTSAPPRRDRPALCRRRRFPSGLHRQPQATGDSRTARAGAKLFRVRSAASPAARTPAARGGPGQAAAQARPGRGGPAAAPQPPRKRRPGRAPSTGPATLSRPAPPRPPPPPVARLAANPAAWPAPVLPRPPTRRGPRSPVGARVGAGSGAGRRAGAALAVLRSPPPPPFRYKMADGVARSRRGLSPPPSPRGTPAVGGEGEGGSGGGAGGRGAPGRPPSRRRVRQSERGAAGGPPNQRGADLRGS